MAPMSTLLVLALLGSVRAEGDCAPGWTGEDCDEPVEERADEPRACEAGGVCGVEGAGSPPFVVLSESPRIYYFPQFLSDEEVPWRRRAALRRRALLPLGADLVPLRFRRRPRRSSGCSRTRARA